MSEEYVLDASALLAFILGERGAEEVEPLMRDGVLSAVNLCETVTKLSERGMPEDRIAAILGRLATPVVPFDREQAVVAGNLRPQTRALGLSLGDRACLALGSARGATVVTTDRLWSRLDLGVAVRVVDRAAG